MNSHRTILVVEDERPLLEAIKKKLQQNNIEVITATTAEQALDYVENSQSIDAIWLDHYLMGKSSGLDFVSQIKEEKSKNKKIPIFVISNTASEDKVQSYLRLGVNKYFTKSNYRLDDIIKEINTYLKEK